MFRKMQGQTSTENIRIGQVVENGHLHLKLKIEINFIIN